MAPIAKRARKIQEVNKGGRHEALTKDIISSLFVVKEKSGLSEADIAAMRWSEGQAYWTTTAPTTASTTNGVASTTPMESPRSPSPPTAHEWPATIVADRPQATTIDDFDGPTDVLKCLEPAEAGTQVDAELFKLATTLTPKSMTEAPQTRDERELMQAAENGVDLDNGLGQRFLRAVHAAKKSGDPAFQSYVGSRADKGEWRRRWANDKYKVIVEKKVKSETWKHLDFKRATYKVYDWILREQGGRESPATVRGTAMLIKRSLNMGEPFYRRSPWTDRIEFAHFEEGWEVNFEQCWTIFKEQVKKTTIVGGADGKQKDIDIDPVVNESVAADHDRPEKASKTTSKKTATPKDDSVTRNFSAAARTKANYYVTTSKADKLMAQIAERGLAKEWHRAAVQRFGEETVSASLKAIQDSVMRATENIGKEIRKLHNMHAQNMK